MNFKKATLAIVSVTILWFIMDFIIHGHLLMQQYMATSNLWRPVEEMNPVIGLISTLIFSIIYVFFYMLNIQDKDTAKGFKFGFWYGLISGFSLYCTIYYMPIPTDIGVSWFLAAWVESMLAGILMGYITRES